MASFLKPLKSMQTFSSVLPSFFFFFFFVYDFFWCFFFNDLTRNILRWFITSKKMVPVYGLILKKNQDGRDLEAEFFADMFNENGLARNFQCLKNNVSVTWSSPIKHCVFSNHNKSIHSQQDIMIWTNIKFTSDLMNTIHFRKCWLNDPLILSLPWSS